jgi:hypothetical protein
VRERPRSPLVTLGGVGFRPRGVTEEVRLRLGKSSASTIGGEDPHSGVNCSSAYLLRRGATPRRRLGFLHRN